MIRGVDNNKTPFEMDNFIDYLLCNTITFLSFLTHLVYIFVYLWTRVSLFGRYLYAFQYRRATLLIK